MIRAINTVIPPLPVFIKGSNATFHKGKQHFLRQFDIFDILFVTKGKLYMKEDGMGITVAEGQYLILVPHLEHSGFRPCDENTEFFWVHFTFHSSFSLVEEKKLDWSNIIKRNHTFTKSDLYELYLPRFGTFRRKEQAVNLFTKLLNMNDSTEPSDKMKQQTYFFDIIIQIQKDALEVPSSAQNIALQCVEYIDNHYKELDFRVRDMAQKLLYHPDYVTRAMKKTIGMSPVQYLNQCRLTKAKELLQQESLDLLTVAKEAGFTEVSYFSRVFKKNEGMTPGEYRRVSFTNYIK
ncbi:helix-turn-helix transcriptional regulator [Salipaludibacillus daqingensis]|uniref:helix-turn-helix transcriptional regulator n=1 Tax=Salipaludibacillus daqingensis TaxID=3041001 RepID=UPI002476C81C|nr:AraC family transcriptional regulator [Salipaludibacillus daqingensis]